MNKSINYELEQLKKELEYATRQIQQLTVAGGELAGWCYVLYERTNHVDTARELKQAIRDWENLV